MNEYSVILCTGSKSDADFSPSNLAVQLIGEHSSTGWRNIINEKVLLCLLDGFLMELYAIYVTLSAIQQPNCNQIKYCFNSRLRPSDLYTRRSSSI